MIPLTVKDLKALILNVPDHYIVCYCKDDANNEKIQDIKAETVYISAERETVTLLSDED